MRLEKVQEALKNKRKIHYEYTEEKRMRKASTLCFAV